MKDYELAILGKQFLLALQLEASGFQRTLELKDAVLGVQVPAAELFQEQNDRWFLRGESVPGDLALKMIAVDSEAAFLETSPLDNESVERAIREEMLPFRYDAEKREFSDTTTNVVLATISEPKTPEFEETKLGARVLWTMPIAGLNWVRKNALVRLADAMYNYGCFQAADVEVDSEPVRSVVQVQKLQLKLTMHLQQHLKLEQRPVLALRQVMTVKQVQTLQLELRQIMAMQHRILRMSPAELENWVTEDTSPAGQQRALSVMLFTLAGQVKKTQPQLSWPEARKVAHKLVNKMSSVARPGTITN